MRVESVEIPLGKTKDPLLEIARLRCDRRHLLGRVWRGGISIGISHPSFLILRNLHFGCAAIELAKERETGRCQRKAWEQKQH